MLVAILKRKRTYYIEIFLETLSDYRSKIIGQLSYSFSVVNLVYI